MKTIKFKGKDYQCPEKWEEVTLRMVIATQRLSDLLPDAPLIAIIGGYTGIDVEEIKSADILAVNTIVDTLSFVSTEYRPTPRNEFTLHGCKYSTLPDLAETQFQDWLAIQTIMYNHRQEPVLGLARMLAVYCKLEGETLDDINLDVRQDAFMDLPYTTAKDVEGFFLANLSAWRQITQLSSREPEMREAILRQVQELSHIMKQSAMRYGWYSPTRWGILIYRRYLLYLKHELEKSFSSTLSEP